MNKKSRGAFQQPFELSFAGFFLGAAGFEGAVSREGGWGRMEGGREGEYWIRIRGIKSTRLQDT